MCEAHATTDEDTGTGMRVVTLKRAIPMRAYRGDPQDTFDVMAKALVGTISGRSPSDEVFMHATFAIVTGGSLGPDRHMVARPNRPYFDFMREERGKLGGGDTDLVHARAKAAFEAPSNLTTVQVTIPNVNVDGIADEL